MLHWPKGATIAQIAEATEWQTHMVRAFFAGFEKRQSTAIEAAERVCQVGFVTRALGRVDKLTSPHEAVRMDFQWGMAAAWPELEGGGLAGGRRLDVRTTSGAGGR